MCFLKLDMSKAYDQVEWGFLVEMMQTLCFHQKWISLVMKCITTVSYSVEINGAVTGFFSPERGLH